MVGIQKCDIQMGECSHPQEESPPDVPPSSREDEVEEKNVTPGKMDTPTIPKSRCSSARLDLHPAHPGTVSPLWEQIVIFNDSLRRLCYLSRSNGRLELMECGRSLLSFPAVALIASR